MQGLILILYSPPESTEVEEKEFQCGALGTQGVDLARTAGTYHYADHQQKHILHMLLLCSLLRPEFVLGQMVEMQL